MTRCYSEQRFRRSVAVAKVAVSVVPVAAVSLINTPLVAVITRAWPLGPE